MLASEIINDVTDSLHDSTNTRWSRAWLLARINDAQRAVVIVRPDASVSVLDHALVAGWSQTIPATAIRLMEVKANTSGRACRLGKREDLDMERPSWRTDTPATTIRNWLYDVRTPKNFEVWPPAAIGASLKIAVSVSPAEITAESNAITLDDLYADPIRNYVLHRAFARDSEDAANLEVSSAYYGYFMQALTGRTQSELAARPENATMQRTSPEGQRA